MLTVQQGCVPRSGAAAFMNNASSLVGAHGWEVEALDLLRDDPGIGRTSSLLNVE